jgi:hypothetical protein
MKILELLPGLDDPGFPILVETEDFSIICPRRNGIPCPGRKALALVYEFSARGVQGP